MMRKKGFSLVELVMTIVLSSILLLVMTCQMIALVRFNRITEFSSGVTQEAPVAVREANIIMRHMERNLRNVFPDENNPGSSHPVTPTTPNNWSLSAWIREVNNAGSENWHKIEYYYNTEDNSIYFKSQGADIPLSRNLDSANSSITYDSDTHVFTIHLTFKDSNNRSIAVDTRVKAVGE